MDASRIKRQLKRLYVYQRYVHGSLVGGLIIALFVLVLVHTAAAVFMAPQLLLSAQAGPGFYIVTGTTGLILVFLVVFLAGAFAGDISGGGAQLFLSQPLSREAYVAAWMIAVLATPTLLYLLSFTLPLLILDPALLGAVGVTGTGLLAVEVVEVGALLSLIAVASKSRAAVVVLGLFLELLLPWVLLVPFIVLVSVPGVGQRLTWAVTAYLVLFPSKYTLFATAPTGPPLTPTQLAAAGLAVAVLYAALTLLYARYRLEVK